MPDYAWGRVSQELALNLTRSQKCHLATREATQVVVLDHHGYT